MFDARSQVLIALLQRFNAEGIEFAYPTQTSFTAAPDGTLDHALPGARSRRPDDRSQRTSATRGKGRRYQRQRLDAGAEALRPRDGDQAEAERPAELPPDGRAARRDILP